MLANFNFYPTIPALDMQRARRFYQEKLGLTPTDEAPGGLMYEFGESRFLLYPSQFAGTAQHTVMGCMVDDLDSVVAELKANGVVFEEYNMPDLKTVNSIAVIGPNRGAWFKDSEGNILGLVEM
jgi:predicted enzyme related to lactoylglutathione lyase